MIVNLSPTRTVYLGDITATNIYKSFTYKMAAKTSWNEITSMSRYIYTG